MTPSPDPIAALRASHNRLRTVAEPLTPEQLRQRGYPSEWSIAQVLSHIGSGAEINAMVVDAGLAGQEPPGRDVFPPIWDRWNVMSPDQQAADGLRFDAALVDKLEANADSQARFTIWGGDTDIRGVARARLSEHGIHTWDVAVALDPSATILPEAVEIVVDLITRVASWTAKPSPWTGVVKVSTTDPDREFRLTLGEKSTMDSWTPDSVPPDATLVMPTEALIRLLSGRLDPGHTPATVTAAGITVDALREVFQGY